MADEDKDPEYETTSGEAGLAFIQSRIVIEAGLDKDGNRGVSCGFYDLSKEVDENGQPFAISYFEGKQLLAVAEDQFLIQYGMLHPPNYLAFRDDF